MPRKEIPDSAIELVAKHINTRSNKNYSIPLIGHQANIETPQVFEIIPSLKRALRELGLSEQMLSIGWQRGYYRCTLAENWQEYLLGDTNRVMWKSFNQRDLVDYWHERWVAPRLDTLQTNLELCPDP